MVNKNLIDILIENNKNAKILTNMILEFLLLNKQPSSTELKIYLSDFYINDTSDLLYLLNTNNTNFYNDSNVSNGSIMGKNIKDAIIIFYKNTGSIGINNKPSSNENYGYKTVRTLGLTNLNTNNNIDSVLYYISNSCVYIKNRNIAVLTLDNNTKNQDDLSALTFLIPSIKKMDKKELLRLKNISITKLNNNANIFRLQSILNTIPTLINKKINDDIERKLTKLNDLESQYRSLLTELNDLKLKTALNKDSIERQIIQTLYDTLNAHPLTESISIETIKDYNMIKITVLTKLIPQNFIDMTNLEKVQDSIVLQSSTPAVLASNISDLLNYKATLYVGKSRMIFLVDLFDVTHPIHLFFTDELSYNTGSILPNKHTQYFNTSYRGNYGQSDANFKGCLGGFEPILLRTNANIYQDIKNINKYVSLVYQYLQTTNPVDVAGRTNFRRGKYIKE